MKQISRTLGCILLGLMAIVLGAMPASAAQFAYVTNRDSNTVSVIDRVTMSVVAIVPVGLGPAGVAVTPNAAFAYVANYSSTTLSVIENCGQCNGGHRPGWGEPPGRGDHPERCFRLCDELGL